MPATKQSIDDAYRWLMRAQVGTGLFMFGTPLAIFGWQIVMWLRDGRWTEQPFYHYTDAWGVPYPYTNWRGLQTIINALMEVHAGFWFFFTGLAVAAVLMVLLTKLDNQYRDIRDAEIRAKAKAAAQSTGNGTE